MQHNETGHIGEGLAKEFLLQKGYDILSLNYRYLKSEIDIIAKKSKTIHFVEVKTRINPMVETAWSVGKKKQENIIKAANHFMQNLDENLDCQFDIITITFYQKNQKPEVNHIEEAFYPLS